MARLSKVVPAILTDDPKALNTMVRQAESFTTYVQFDVMGRLTLFLVLVNGQIVHAHQLYSHVHQVVGSDLRLVGMVLEKNGEIVDTAAGAAVLGNPAEAVAWLTNKLNEYNITLRKGEFIISGSLTRAREIESGSFFRATFDRLGSVSAFIE